MNNFGSRLREARVTRGMSQAQLAGDDLSPSYVSLLEAGKRQPSPDVVRLLAGRLGCEPTELEDPTFRQQQDLVQLELSFARLALSHGDAESARTRLTALLDSGSLDRATRDRALCLLATAHEKAHDLDAAVRVLLPVYQRVITGQSQIPLPTVGIALCRFYLDSGDLHAAVRAGEQALKAGEDRGLTATDEYLRLAATVGAAYHELGDLTQAAAYLGNFIEIAETENLPAGQSALYWNAALVAEARDRPEEALHLCERALALVSEGDTTRDLARLRSEVAWLILRADPERAAEAVSLLQRTLPVLQDLGSPADLATWERVRSLADLLTGYPEQAERTARQALLHLSSYPSTETTRVLITLGDALAAQGSVDEACAQYHAALEQLSPEAPTRLTASLWRAIGDRLLLFEHAESAIHVYQKALDAAGINGDLATLKVAQAATQKQRAKAAVRRT